jgi:tetratricopeptide (TPR) repeat protein
MSTFMHIHCVSTQRAAIKSLAVALTLSLVGGTALSASALASNPQHDHEAVPAGAAVPLFEGLGDHSFEITTSSPEAQRYFDQGLMFTYGFNHFEAVRSFEEAVRRDDECAMCYWGVALAHGPHINAPMMPDAVEPAYEVLQRALELAPETTEREQAYIAALSHRYALDPPEDREPLDRAYADAMRDLVESHPDDLDAATLFAESLMNLVPWNYWTAEGEARPETEELVAALESVLEQDPHHPGATHYYIHAIENSPEPQRAEGAADRLSELNIQIGHMIHMPAHIYARIGRWHDASVANENAIEADEAYLAAYEVEGMVPLLYHPHNVHFLSWTAGVEGRSERAYDAARDLVEATPGEMASDLLFLNSFLSAPTLTLVRFQRWDEVMDLAPPEHDTVFQTAIHHYARGLAHAAEGRLDEAREHSERLGEIVRSEEAMAIEQPEAFFPGGTMLQIADLVLRADIKLLEGGGDEPIALLREAVELQDGLPYMEPPYWFASARFNLGGALLALDRPEEAEEVFRADLDEYPENGWALFGLKQSLQAQDRAEDADQVATRFGEAWEQADVSLTINERGIAVER